jgi:putative FmdB family regulatory protein
MPTYEYFCKSCQRVFERFERITAEPNPECPLCGQASAQRKISGGAGLQFTGSGFYITDYKKSAAGNKSNGKVKESESASGKQAKEPVSKAD